MNGTLETLNDHPALRFERRLGHSVDRVWRAIAEPEELGQWFPGVPDWTLEAGTEFTVKGAGDQGGRIIEVEPPRLIAYEWGGDRFRFELEPDGDGCRLLFVHELEKRELGAQNAAGWHACFERLDGLLAGRPVSEEQSLERWPELHERYAESFGLDPEVGRRGFAEHSQQR